MFFDLIDTESYWKRFFQTLEKVFSNIGKGFFKHWKSFKDNFYFIPRVSQEGNPDDTNNMLEITFPF